MKILITGGAGFVGSSLADRLLENEKYEVVIIDNLITGKKENIPVHARCTFVEGDVNDLDVVTKVMTNANFDYVFHYAALVGVKRTLNHPIMVLDDIKGMENILNLCRDTGVKRVFYSSSSEVYGEPVELPQNELTTPLNSRLPYAIVKNVGEAFFRSYHQEYGLDYTIFRFFNTYGPKQSEDFVISKFVKAALKGEDITIYGDGSQTRTFCYVNDNLEATIKCMEEDRFVNEVINVGSDTEITIRELAYEVIKAVGADSDIVHLPALKEGDMTRRLPSIDNMRTLINRDFVSLHDGLKRLLPA